MCGIAGIWHLDGRPVDPAALKRMADALAHRGPDGEGYRVDGDLGLAHRRLKIVDPGPQSHQPMADESGRYHIVYNGEIHNYVELRRELESAGATFRSAGDTEVALQAFLRWGDGCFDRFNGMWALAVWDARDRVLTLSRDRFGIKPLVISRRGARFAFASEPKAILAAFPEEHEPDLRELSGYAQGAVPDLNLDVILDVPVSLSLEVGRARIPIRNLLQLNQGSVVELERGAGEPLDVYVNGTLIAQGEVVVVNDRFGVRLTDVVSPSERIKRLR